MYFLFHNDYQFSKDSKIKPFGLKILNFKDKKISSKYPFFQMLCPILPRSEMNPLMWYKVN
ncbi:hypothetical protein EAH81_21920 [Flavobacterium pectinovorum]|uniref:Uncharacterized protein n=1 Tax=Flavobacterium pectinovorum TaxID=29533 RepID=A0A502EDA5_9FLAO|nr:hypothetical protein EAH81_21920 [Flavobacterium pectinovorum]